VTAKRGKKSRWCPIHFAPFAKWVGDGNVWSTGLNYLPIRANGRLVATRVPLQVSAVGGADKRLDLHVANAGLAEMPAALHVSWRDFEAGDSDASENARYLFGGGVLLILLGLMSAATLRQRRALRAG